jgi:hypothetical protein
MKTSSPAINRNDQLVAMLKKPNGMRVSRIGEKLNWQAHTVRGDQRAAQKGYEISRSKAKSCSREAWLTIIADQTA